MAQAKRAAGLEELPAEGEEETVDLRPEGADLTGEGVAGAEPAEEAAGFCGRAGVEFLELAVEAELADLAAEVVGGNGGDVMGFIQHHKIVREEDAGNGGTGGLAGGDEGEEEVVIDDDKIGFADGGAGTLERAMRWMAVPAVTGIGVGVEPFPDAWIGGRFEFHPQAGGRGLGPIGDAVQFGLLGAGEQLGAGLEGFVEAGGAEVIGAAEEDGVIEVGEAGQTGDGAEESAAEREVLFLDLFLEGDGIGGDDERAFGGLCVEEAGEEVGEAFADAGAGLEEEGLIVLHGGHDGVGHAGLLRAVFEAVEGLEDAVGCEQLVDLRWEAERGRRVAGRGVHGLIQANHVRTMGGAMRWRQR